MLAMALDKAYKSQVTNILELFHKSVYGDLLGSSGLPNFETESIDLVSMARNPIITFCRHNHGIISGLTCIELDPAF